MKKKKGYETMKKHGLLVMLLVMCCLMWCSISTVSAQNETNYPKIEEIEWSLKPYLSDTGTERVSFDYTNNSDYTIASVEMKWIPKEDSKERSLEDYKDIQEALGLSAEDIMSLYIWVCNRKVCEPGQSVNNSGCSFNSWTYVEPDYMSAFDLMEPESMIISYLKDDLLCTVKYDYLNGLYMEGSDSTKAYTWSESELAKKVPKLEARVSEIILDIDTNFSINVYGIDKETYESYINTCKDAGFTEDFSYEPNTGVVVTSDSDGNMLLMDYLEEDSGVSISISES